MNHLSSACTDTPVRWRSAPRLRPVPKDGNRVGRWLDGQARRNRLRREALAANQPGIGFISTAGSKRILARALYFPHQFVFPTEIVNNVALLVAGPPDERATVRRADVITMVNSRHWSP